MHIHKKKIHYSLTARTENHALAQNIYELANLR